MPKTVERKHTAARANKFTAEKRRVVLVALRDGKTVEMAAAAAGVDRSTVFLVRQADQEFREAFEAARDEGTELVEDELWAGALHGKKINFPAVIAILNARRPERYRQNMKVEHGGAVAVSEATLGAARARYENGVKPLEQTEVKH